MAKIDFLLNQDILEDCFRNYCTALPFVYFMPFMASNITNIFLI